MPRDSAAADRPASYLVGTAAAFPLFFRDRTKPINQLPFSPSAKFPKSGSSCESRGKTAAIALWLGALTAGVKLPRRLVYVVDRRTVVDQASDEADMLASRLG